MNRQMDGWTDGWMDSDHYRAPAEWDPNYFAIQGIDTCKFNSLSE